MRTVLPIAFAALLSACERPAPPPPAVPATTATAATTTTAPTTDHRPEPTTFQVGKLALEKLPEGLVVAGTPQFGAQFSDVGGNNIVVLSRVEETLDLHAVHALLQADAPPRILHEVTQLRGECEFDYSAAFVGPPVITDLDGDDRGEVTFGYKYACRSDVSPQDYRVVLLEGSDESVLRGAEIVMIPGDPEPFGDGKATPEGFDSPKLLDHAKDYWKRNVLTRM